jgi:hypothetical protein
MEIRRFTRTALGSAVKALRGTGNESLAVASVEPKNFQLTSGGLRYIGGIQDLSFGIAPVQTIPNPGMPVAPLALFNPELPRGKSLGVDRVTVFLSTGVGVPAFGLTLMAAVSTKPLAPAPMSMSTGYGVSPANGIARPSRALFVVGATLPSTPAPAWVSLFSNLEPSAPNLGQGDGWINLRGGFVVPPGHALGLAVLSGPAAAGYFGISVSWVELEADLET